MPSHESTSWTCISRASSLDALEGRAEVTALRVDHSTLPDLEALENLPRLRRLVLVGVVAPSLDSLGRLPSLTHLAILGGAFGDAGPLLDARSLQECVLRAVPWSDESRREVLPALQAREGLACEVSESSQWVVTRDSFEVFGACAEPVGDGKALVVFPGAAQPVADGPFLVPSQDLWMLVSMGEEPAEMVDLVQSKGEPAEHWVSQLLALGPAGVDAAVVLSALEGSGLPPALVESFRRYVAFAAGLRFAHAPGTRHRAPEGAHPAIAALVDVVGPWQLPSPPEIRLGDEWWRWYPDGAWTGLDRGPGGRPMLGVALDEGRELGLWVEVAPDSSTAVWQASIADHEPGRPLQADTILPFAPSLAAMLDSIDAVRLPDGTVIHSTAPPQGA